MPRKSAKNMVNHNLIKILICIGLIVVIVLRNNDNCNYSHLASLVLLYIIIESIVNNIVLSFIYTVIVWVLLFVVLTNYLNLNLRENFENNENREKNIDNQTKKRVSHLKNIIKKLEGGIALTDDDLVEKNNIKDYDFKKSRVSKDEDENTKNKDVDDYTPREAQKETFQLINTVKQLKDTVTELAPILKEGKTILSSLGALKI
jgi:energy-coupling factor transporter transmembrane protein EcfT